MKNQCFLILSGGEWKDSAVSNMQISAELSKNNKVIYVETPGRRFPKLKEFGRVIERLKRIFFDTSKSKKVGLDPINTIICSPLAIPNQSFLIFRKINHFLLKYQVEYFLRKNNFTEIIIWTFSPYWIEVIEKLGYKLLIFHCVDGLHTYDSSAHFLKSFNRLSEVADMIFTPGLLLHSELKEINQNTFMIGHGVKEENILNQQDFTDLILPSELKGTARDKVVVYSGTLANWVDYELLYKCAEELEDHIFILIGYVHALSPSQEVRDLHKLRNIIFTGYKSYEELPSYYLFSSIGIVPYQANNEHIQYSTPTKFLDYFAFGLEVVSTNFPSAKNLEPLVKVANNHEEFIKLIKDISSSPTSDKINETAISYACSHTWEIQVAKMLEQIENQFNE